jgi:hypothetical protein
MMIHKIDLSHRSRHPSFIARLIWQDLFNYYVEQNGNLKDMDSFLCDLSIFEHFIEKRQEKIYWNCDPESGYTDVQEYAEPYKHNVEIDVKENCINLIYSKPE